jgi:hypothetical protein
VHTSGWRQGHHGGDPQGRLRQPHIFSHASEQSLLTSFLRAHSSGWCWRTRQKVPRMLILHQQRHVPTYKLVTIPPTWPFAWWGLDMIGPLPTAPRGFNRVLVAINKFTKVDRSQSSYLPRGWQSTRLLRWTCAPLRATPSHHHRLGFQLQQPSVLEILREQRDRRLVHLSRPPSRQQSSGACQWDGTRRPQEAIARRS